MKNNEALRDRAAIALDLTHSPDLAYRGPKTYMTRQRLGTWLDDGRVFKLADLKWLEHIARRGTDSR